MGTYAVIAHELTQGGRLYSGYLFDIKPPAIFATFYAGEMLWSYGRLQIYMLGVTAAVLTLLGTLLLINALGARAAFWGALFWVLICSTLSLEANQPNAECFINAVMMIGLALLLHRKLKNNDWLVGAGAGLCFAIASLYKHCTAIVPICVLLAYVVWPIQGRSRVDAFKTLVIVGTIGILTWVGTLGYFHFTGRSEAFINWMFLYDKHYAGSLADNLLRIQDYFPRQLIPLSPLFALALLGILLAIIQKMYHEAAFLLAMALGTALAIALPGRFYMHYYQLWFPFLVIASSFAIKYFDDWPSLSMFKRVFPPCIALTLLFFQVPSALLSAKECSVKKYGYVFINADKVAGNIRRILKGNETVFQIGDEAEIYFDAKISPPGLIINFSALSGPLSDQVTQIVMKTMNARPDLILLQKYTMPAIPKNSALWKSLEENYTPINPDFYCEPFYFLAKKNSNLEKRMESAFQSGSLK